ncbi:MAG: hypothetical protein GXX85_13700 [Ignavibacteria bacterium]|nr:hypothetical protein [Ignavibacteria bacterium]
MRYFAVIILILLYGCAGTNNYSLSDDFYGDLGSEDLRVAGELYLDYFDENLTNLTYDYYIGYLSKTEAPSAKGLTEIIKNADDHYLTADTSNFYLGLYFADDNVIICDYSGSAFTDSVAVYGLNDSIPELKEFVEKTGRKNR